VEDRGTSLSELIADAIQKDVVTALRAIQAFLPKESKVEWSIQEVGLVDVLDSLSREQVERDLH
jgi:hypothetical protein